MLHAASRSMKEMKVGGVCDTLGGWKLGRDGGLVAVVIGVDGAFIAR